MAHGVYHTTLTPRPRKSSSKEAKEALGAGS